MKKLCGILLLVAIVFQCAKSDQRNEILCSVRLNEMLSQLCGASGFNNLIPQKRSSLDLIDYVDNENSIIPYPLESARLKSFYNQNFNSLTQTRRRQRGIVDECCKKVCTVPELMTYCNMP